MVLLGHRVVSFYSYSTYDKQVVNSDPDFKFVTTLYSYSTVLEYRYVTVGHVPARRGANG